MKTDTDRAASLRTPQIGLGTFPFSGVFSPITQTEAASIVQTFIEGGGRYLETAPVYPIKEVSLATILADYPRDAFFVATKCVTSADSQGNKVRSGKHETVIAQCEAEIARLGVEHLDLLQAHIVAEDVPLRETAEALQSLKDRGSTRFIGVSNVNLNQLKEYASYASIDFVQNRFSFIHRQENRLIESYCAEKNILLNPYQVIERGQLTTQHASSPAPWRDGDLRRSKHEYMGEAHETILKWVSSELLPIARSVETSVEALVLAWTLQQPQIMVPVVGATKVSQIRELLRAATIHIAPDVLRLLEEAYASLENGVRQRYGLSVDEYRGL